MPWLLVAEKPYYATLKEAYESEQVQRDLFPDLGDAKDSEASSHTPFYVADAEAMCTGYILWIQPDQYGNSLQRNCIQPWSLGVIDNMKTNGFKLSELRFGHEDGFISELGNKPDENVVSPWQPPSG